MKMTCRPFGLLAALCACVGASAVRVPHLHQNCGHASALRKAFLRGLNPTLEARIVESVADTDVLHNTLNIAVAPPSNVVSGNNTILAKSLQNGLTEFTFRLSDTFTMGPVTLDGRPISVTRLDATTCRAFFDRPYAANEQFSLYIPYDGPAISSFFGSISFGTRSNGSPYCFSLSEPWYAYTWWPNKDDNRDKSTFDINITTPETLTAVSNGLLQGVDSLPNNQKRYRWRTNYQMVPYLASIAVTNYNTWSTTYNHANGSMPVQFWIWPESDTTNNRTAWGKCVEILEKFSPIFGEYPFINEKYGMYQFTFGGGMEHQTASGMGGFWESVNAHEAAHQWWGNMVTCATWHDIWLNEGFASYSEALWSERKTGGSFAAYKTTMNGRRPSQTSGTVYCYNITDPNRIFSSTYSYNKGAWVMHMLRRIVGDSTFFNILADYRAAHLHSAATTDDFIASCERVYGKDLNWFFDKFVYGGGAPAYRWGWQSVTSNGKHYLLVSISQNQNTTYGTFSMPIDIRPTVGGVKQSLKVFNDALVENYVIPLTGASTACTFDEDAWVLSSAVTATAHSLGGPTIVETSPSPLTRVSVPVNQIRVTFHTNVNASSRDFRVLETGSGREFRDFTYSYSSGTNTATLQFSRPLAGNYTVHISDNIRAVNSNLRLDGEMSAAGTLPSGNGQPLGSASFSFTARR